MKLFSVYVMVTIIHPCVYFKHILDDLCLKIEIKYCLSYWSRFEVSVIF